MDFQPGHTEQSGNLRDLTRAWGRRKRVSLYLDRCQVDTPHDLVDATWRHVHELRNHIDAVLDFGAGDGRFARAGRYAKYIGYEIDPDRSSDADLPRNARILNRCAFEGSIKKADLCIGNPPFVRNQDLPEGWQKRASSLLQAATGVQLSGLANAWQYFFLQSLISTKEQGLVALVIPYEWVSRPAAKAIREYITKHKWNVSVYRLVDTTFDSVLTTSSITIVDKASHEGQWRYFEETADGNYKLLRSPSGAATGYIPYTSRKKSIAQELRAIRGLSPGTQQVFTLTEDQRVKSKLRIGRDVVPCVTTLRNLPADVTNLTSKTFDKYFRDAGQKCWLIKTDKKRSNELIAYLRKTPSELYQTTTCLERRFWWKFRMPKSPSILLSMSFRGRSPKSLRNVVGAKAVGGVCGIFNVPKRSLLEVQRELRAKDLRKRVVAHSNGLRKIEINQLNSLLCNFLTSP